MKEKNFMLLIHGRQSRSYMFIAAAVLVTGTAVATLTTASAPPATERRDVTETFYGQKVTDRYRWLEDWHDAPVQHWLKAQNDYTRGTLARIPGRDKFLARVRALDTAATRVRNAQVWGGKTFYLKTEPGGDNLKLYVRDRIASSERLLVDPAPNEGWCALFDRLLSAVARRRIS